MIELDIAKVVVHFSEIRLALILLINLGFVYGMITKKMSTLLALPLMGIVTAVISTVGVLPLAGLFDMVDTGGEQLPQLGVMNGVVMEGAKMMASAISAAVFGAAFAKLLNKAGVAEEIIKRSAELAGDRPMVLAMVFFIAATVIFSAIGGLGAVILVGTIALPIMMTAGITPTVSGIVVLLGLSAGGILNPANFATYSAIMSPAMDNNQAAAYKLVAEMSFPIFIIVSLLSIFFIYIHVKKAGYQRAWSMPKNKLTEKRASISNLALLTPLIPVLVVLISTLFGKTIPAEIAITLGIIYLVFTTKLKGKLNNITASFVEGTQDVAGAIVLLIGLGILIKGFQYFTVEILITPMITSLISYLQNPWTFIIGFTLASPLVLYRGPLNTFGIGGALPIIFASAGFSPLAIVWVLRTTGNFQGFGDPTNSQNIWIADFVQVDANEITKKVFGLGIIITFCILIYAVFVQGITLTM